MINYFHWSSLTCVYTTDDKNRIQETLYENKIPFKLSVKDLSIRNKFDLPYGSIGTNRLKLSYEFYVKKKDIEFALHLIK
jgi:hypothetical protein